MKRRAFALYSVGLVFIAALAFLAGIGLLRFVADSSGFGPGDPRFQFLATGGAILFAGTLLWAIVAMAIKRCRDAGAPKAPIAAGLPGVPFLDHMILAPMTPEPLAWPLDAFTPVALFALVGLYLFLLLAPSQPIAPLVREDEATSVPETDGVYA